MITTATLCGADTTTTLQGKVSLGKKQFRKDLKAIMVAHNIPYAAQTVPVISGTKYMLDIYNKADKAINIYKGSTFMNVLTPCPRGWRIDTVTELDVIKLAVDTCFWPLYEVENGKYKLNYKSAKKLPITDWIKSQGRFKHLFKNE